ncbi:MAG: FeoA family protein [Bacteroidota bacterium]
MSKPLTLAHLKKGQQAIIESLAETEFSLKLMEMGCVPGETVRLEKVAPLGDPIAVLVSGYTLSLRKAEAETVRLKKS